jgi:hypothetical protein
MGEAEAPPVERILYWKLLLAAGRRHLDAFEL